MDIAFGLERSEDGFDDLLFFIWRKLLDCLDEFFYFTHTSFSFTLHFSIDYRSQQLALSTTICLRLMFTVHMNILFLVPYTPTLIRTRPHNLVRGLSRRGHAVTLATLWENEQERAALAELEREGIRVLSARLTKPRALWNMLRALPTTAPLQSAYCWQPELARILSSNFQLPTSKFDVVHVEHLRGARYALQLLTSNLQLPVVWDSVDCISHLFEQAARHSRSPFGRIVTRFELARTRRYEAMLANRFARVLVTSPVDAAALTALASRLTPHASRTADSAYAIRHTPSAITVLPNGVDLKYFTPGTAPRDPDTIVFSGKLSYHANVTAALHLVNDLMPRVWRERPNVRVNIVGHNPPRQLRDLITHHASGITLLGSVPDIRPYLKQAGVAVAPMPYGAGIQNKVLEAMACATPVVATPQAVSAIQAIDGEHLLLGAPPAVFARQVLRLLEDANLRARVGAAGRRYAETHHDWNTIAKQLEEIYDHAVKQSRFTK